MPRTIFTHIATALCNDKCENPPDIPQKSVFATPDGDGCEIAIAIESGVEAWAYRGTHSQGAQWQDCWDSTLNVSEHCYLYCFPKDLSLSNALYLKPDYRNVRQRQPIYRLGQRPRQLRILSTRIPSNQR